MAKTTQQAEQDLLTTTRAWVLADKKFRESCTEEKAAGRWSPGPETDTLSDNWRVACREAAAAMEAMRDAAYALTEVESDVANQPVAKAG